MHLNFRAAIHKAFYVATVILFGLVYFFRERNPKIIIGYSIVYFIFWIIFMVYLVGVIISELRNVKLKQLMSNMVVYIVAVILMALFFYGIDYLIKPEKLSIERSLFKGMKCSIWIVVAKIMLKDKKLRKSE